MSEFTDRLLEHLPAKIRLLLIEIDGNEFSEPAFLRAEQLIENYINDLIRGSIIASEKQGVDKVSELHVNMANASLFSHSRKGIYDILESLGGIFVGAMISGIFVIANATQSAPASTSFILITIGSGVLGTILIAIGFQH